MMQVKIVTHYSEDDPNQVSDYCSIEVFVDGTLVAEYGDAYHSQGKAHAEGFVDAIQIIHPLKVDIEYVSVSDYSL